MRRKTTSAGFRVLVVASILIWVFVIITSLLILQLKGDLNPRAAGSDYTTVDMEGKIVDESSIGIAGAKITIDGVGGKSYIFADSEGAYKVRNLVPGEYKVSIVANGYGDYESVVSLSANNDYRFTLHSQQ